VLVFLVASQALSAEVPQAVVKDIVIKGNKRIEEPAIRNRLKTRVGDLFDHNKLREEIRNLYGTGFFRDISVETEGFEGGLRLIFAVAEKPTIREIKIEGNKELKIDKIREKIDISLDAFVNRSAIAENARKIKQYYEEEGYYFAVINYDIKDIPDKGAVVTFKIIENGEFKLKEVNIHGYKGLWSVVLKFYLQNREQVFYFLFGTLDRAELEKDVERIKLYYHNKGYLDVKIEDPIIDIDEKEKNLYLTFKITEGSRYKMGKVSVKGNAVFTEKEVMDEIRINGETYYNREIIGADITAITDDYAEKGYIYADVVPITSPNKEKAIVDVIYEIQEGKKAYLEKIEIAGNIKTHDKVIRRQFKLNEREVYNAREVKDARQRLLNLGFFEEVNVNQLRGSAEDQVVLKLDVKERPTGSFSVGGGYGSEGLFAQAEVVQANIFGRGQRLSLKGIIGKEIYMGELNFFEPFLFDTKISFSGDIFVTQKTFPDYTQRDTGAAVSFGFPIIEELRGSIGYRYDFIRITGIQLESDHEFFLRHYYQYKRAGEGTRRVVDSIRHQKEATATSAITLGLSRDTVNNRFEPSSGQVFSAFTTLAEPWLGGTNSFLSFNLDYGIYVPLFWRIVYGFHTHFAYVHPFESQVIPVSERLYIGGATTVRGFKPRYVGPMFDDRPIGGNKAWYLNNELTFPLFWTFRGAFFFDAGNAWLETQNIDPSSMRIGAGAGVRFLSPLGPIRLDYGFNLFPRPHEPRSQFHFLVGTFF
jgi:outer membrane protein insertion porin family